jgi:spore coat protein CotH
MLVRIHSEGGHSGVQIDMDPDDIWEMRTQTRTIADIIGGEDCMDQPFESPFTTFHADVRVDDTWVEDVGVRKKGLLGSLSVEKPSLKVKFDKFVAGQELLGHERLTLNNDLADPSHLRQCIGYGLFRHAGLPAPRCTFAEVTLGWERLGIYSNVQPIKKDFLREQFGDPDGDLYEGTLSDFMDGWTETFEPETDDTDADLGPVHDIADALEAGDDDLIDALEPYLDIDLFIRFWAMEVLIGHWDGYAGNTNNFHIYRDPGPDRVVFLPWGIDWIFHDTEIFQPDQPTSVLVKGELARRLYRIEDTREQYQGTLVEILDEVWDEDAIGEEIDRMEALLGDAVDRGSAEELRAFVDDRRDQVLDEMEDLDFEAPAEPMDDIPCMAEVGELYAEFDASWGTLGADPFETGTGFVEGVYEGQVFPPIPTGAVAGHGENGEPVVALTGWINDTELLQGVVAFDPWAFRPGVWEPWRGAMAGLNYMDVTQMSEPVLIGLMLEGEITLDEASTEPGAPVSGSFGGVLYRP